MSGLPITLVAAIAMLRRLHEAGYDLGPLHAVAIQHDPDLAAGCAASAVIEARYRDQLAKECGAPSFADFVAAWPQTHTLHHERAAYAWRALSVAQRKAAIGGIDAYLAERRLAGYGGGSTAAGYLGWLVR